MRRSSVPGAGLSGPGRAACPLARSVNPQPQGGTKPPLPTVPALRIVRRDDRNQEQVMAGSMRPVERAGITSLGRWVSRDPVQHPPCHSRGGGNPVIGERGRRTQCPVTPRLPTAAHFHPHRLLDSRLRGNDTVFFARRSAPTSPKTRPNSRTDLPTVMAGLDPAIQTTVVLARPSLDPRVKPGDDGSGGMQVGTRRTVAG